MKKILLLFFSIFYIGVSAQITVGPEMQVLSMDISSFDEEIDFEVSNGPDSDRTLLWTMELSENFPSQWLTWLCDINLCYTPSVRSCPPERGNVITRDENQTWKFHATANGVDGSGSVTINVIDATSNEVVGSTIIELTTSAVSADDVQALEAIKIFPNPTVDYFQIAQDQNVSKVGIFSLIGKNILTTNHTPGHRYNVSQFRNGIYLVRLMDDEGEVIKVVRLSKR